MFSRHDPNAERRASPRAPLAAPRACWLFAPGLTGRVAAVMREASVGGCGLYLQQPLRAGDVALLESAAGPPLPRGSLSLRLVRVAEEPGGGYRAGAEFLTPLSASELRALLAPG